MEELKMPTTNNKKTNVFKKIIISGTVVIIGVIGIRKCTTIVPAGYVAVQYNLNGGIEDRVLGQGFHIKPPTISTSLYTIGIEQSYLTSGNKGDSPDDESFSASSKEGKAIEIDLTYTYQYEKNKVSKVFTEFKGQDGKEVRDVFIKPNIISWTKEVLAKYKVSDILGEKKAEVNSELTKYLSKKFMPYGIKISNASLINVGVDKKTKEAINKKIKAQQDAETQKIKNQTNIEKAEAEAKVKETKAEAEAKAKLIRANADAKAKVVKATAESKANNMLKKSLSDKVLTFNYVNKWDGKLPKVQSGDSSMLFDADKLVK